ncbi:methyltransferase, TIGR04325 family [Candidatus Omnitrophota bacterium]
MKDIIRGCIPPIVSKCFAAGGFRKYGWFGDYKAWEDVRKISKGYDSDIILEKVREACMRVKNGKAMCERDSVLFEKIEYSWPLLAGLMWIAASEEGRLDIIDFGGSLGTSYFQNRFFLKTLKEINWNIVEQRHFVECGRKWFEDDRLKFYEAIEDCLNARIANTILFSNVVQYVEKPYDLISKAVNMGFKYIIFDKTAFNSSANGDRLTIQRVNPDIYDASYPCWFLDQDRFKKIIKGKYDLIDEFINFENVTNLHGQIFKGFIYKLI